MRALSRQCSICRRRTLRPLTGDLFICPHCDTAEHRDPRSGLRGCPPNMPGARGGYTVVATPTTSPEE